MSANNLVRANLRSFRLQGLYRKVSGSFSQYMHLEKKLIEAACRKTNSFDFQAFFVLVKVNTFFG